MTDLIQESFVNVKHWLQQTDRFMGDEPVPILLVDIKTDLESSRAVSYVVAKVGV